MAYTKTDPRRLATYKRYYERNKEWHCARGREYYHNNKDKSKDRQLKRKYGISLIEYQQMLEKQHGVCAICGSAPIEQPLYVDHDHQRGSVRKLLCVCCNTLLGHAKENPVILRKAALYLEEYCG